MKHWTPRIADAAEAALAGGARRDRRPRARAALLRALDQGLPRRSSSGARRPRRARFVESWHDEPGFVELLADRVRGTDAHVVFTAHSLPARILDDGRPVQGPAARDVAARRRARRALDATGRSPSRASRRPASRGSGRTSSTTSTALHEPGVDDVLVCPVGFVSDHLEIRWDLDVEAQEKARRARACSSSGSRCRTPIRPSSGRLRGSSGERSRYRHEREAGRDPRRARRAQLSRLPAREPRAEGSRSSRAAACAAPTSGRCATSRSPSSRAARSASSAATAPARRRCCGCSRGSSSRRPAASRSAAASARCSSSAPASTPT